MMEQDVPNCREWKPTRAHSEGPNRLPMAMTAIGIASILGHVLIFRAVVGLAEAAYEGVDGPGYSSFPWLRRRVCHIASTLIRRTDRSSLFGSY